MRYALVSDIHANLPALEAVLASVSRQSDVAATYHLGDLVGYAPWPNETVKLIREFGIPGVAGNYDSTVGADYKHCGCRYEDRKQEELSHVSYSWTRKHVSADTKAFLAGLPFRIDLLPNGGHTAGPRIVLVHGSPTLNTLYWTEDRGEDFCTKMAALAGAKSGDMIAFGHTHIPWHREVGGVHFVNAGSVGRPKDGDWRACYVIVDVGTRPAQVETIRVEYAIDQTIKGILDSDLPGAFAEYLQSGGRMPSAGEAAHRPT